MSINFEVSDTLEPLKHTATALQLFRYSAVTWNPHRIHFDEPYAREEGHARSRAALPPPGGAGLALRYRGPRPPVASHEVRLPPTQARVCAGRPRLHRAGDGDRRRHHDPRAHRAAPVRRGGIRRDGVGQQDTPRERRNDRQMTAAPGRGQRPVRIGNCSGFYGDRASAMAEMARAGGIDVLTGDYLAEVTMLILGKARAKDSTKGYAATFLPQLDTALEHLVANGIRLVVNAGGLNPAGAGRRNAGTDHTPRLPAAGLPHRGRRHLRPPRHPPAGRPFIGAPDDRRAAVIVAASAADRQRLSGRHSASPGR